MSDEKLNENSTARTERQAQRARDVRVASGGVVTDRESEILAMAEEGLSNGEIAKRKGLEVSSVDNVISRVRHKINQRGRALPARDLLEWILRNPPKRPQK